MTLEGVRYFLFPKSDACRDNCMHSLIAIDASVLPEPFNVGLKLCASGAPLQQFLVKAPSALTGSIVP